MVDLRGRWSGLLRRAAEISADVVEISALSAPELPGLIGALHLGRPAFGYIAVHAPTKRLSGDDAALAASLLQLPEWVETIVLHPDVITHPSALRVLGRRAVLENMDARKSDGRFVEELESAFSLMPEAGFCLDLAHVASVDSTMRLGHELLDAFGDRLRQIHLSSLDSEAHHVPLTSSDAERFAGLLQRCGDVPVILEAEPSDWMWTTP